MTLQMQPYYQNGEWVYAYNPALNGLAGDDPAKAALAAAGAASASIAAAASAGTITAAGAAIAAGATAAAAGASVGGAAGALITIGISTQAVPIIGTILGGIALIGGYVLAAQAKAKSIKTNINGVEAQQAELRVELVELDKKVMEAEQSRANILFEMQRLGLSPGLNGIGDWFKKTFTPDKYYGDILEDANAELARLQSLTNERIAYLNSIKGELEQLYTKLTRGKAQQQILLWGGVAITTAGIATAFYFLNKKYKWIEL